MKKSEIIAALKAGLLYFLCIFALGFVLGAIRNIFVIPRIGPVAGVLLEIPVMLTVSWFLCSRLIIRYSVTAETKYLVIFGGTAFLSLMIVEPLVAVFLFKQPWSIFIANIGTLPGTLGLLAQIVFSIIPVMQRKIIR